MTSADKICQGDGVEAFFASSGLNMAVKVGDKVRFMEDLGGQRSMKNPEKKWSSASK